MRGAFAKLRPLGRPVLRLPAFSLAPTRRDFTGKLHIATKSELPIVLPFSWGLSRATPTYIEMLQVGYTGAAQPAKAKEKQRSASRVEVLWPFARLPALANAYRLFSSPYLRIGKIFEALDALAADVAYRHGGDSDGSFVCVTAAVDHVMCRAPLRVDCDLLIAAEVSWVGRSSLEVTMRLCQSAEADGDIEESPIAKAAFLMVARNRELTASMPVPALETATEEDRRLQAAGDANQERRKALRVADLSRSPPTAEEVAILHALFMRRSSAGGDADGTVPISKTVVSSVRIMHSQSRNLHNSIFGGYLMRAAYEAAWVAARRHTCGDTPILFAVDEVAFIQPVHIGAVLSFDAKVVYTESGLAHVRVVAQSQEASGRRSGQVTNAFHFVFTTEDRRAVPPVAPDTYLEAVEYLAAWRHHKHVGAAMEAQDMGRIEDWGGRLPSLCPI